MSEHARESEADLSELWFGMSEHSREEVPTDLSNIWFGM
jgi:hypothetical protein